MSTVCLESSVRIPQSRFQSVESALQAPVLSPLGEAALQYASYGYPVFPCAPGEKRPFRNSGGLKDATTDADRIIEWWTANPTANIAIRTDGLLIVDVDPIDGKPNNWPTDPEQAIDLAVAPVSLTPRGGRHYIFKQPIGRPLRNTQGDIADGVDTRADGGYILVAPSIVNGVPYRWPTERLDCRPDQLPEPPAWLVDLLVDSTSSGRERPLTATPANDIPSGQRNGALTSLGGTMRRKGMSQAAIAAALKVENATRCRPPMGDDEVDVIAWSVSRYEPDQLEVAIAENHFGQDFGDAPNDAPVNVGPTDPGPFPPELLNVGGFIGQVMDHTLATAFVPQPVLALAAALPLQGVLAGRKVRDSQGTRTNIYTLGVCESGGGKERARQVNKEILYKSGQQHLIGPEGFASHVGIINAVEHSPSILFQWDEIGRLLRTTGDTKNAHLFQAPTILMTLFSSSASVFLTAAYADRDKNKSIDQPCACLYGTTVPRSLFEGLTSENLNDGFVSRLMILEASNSDPDPQEPEVCELPRSILDIAEFWRDLKAGDGNLSDLNPTPIEVPYSADASQLMVEFRARVRQEKRQTEAAYATLWTRAVEKAKKLALIWACSRNPQAPVVTAEGALWAIGVSDYLTRRVIFLASRWIGENRLEQNSKRVLRIIEDHGRIDRSTLTRHTQWLTKREREDMLLTLGESGLIRSETETSATRPRLVYMPTEKASANTSNLSIFPRVPVRGAG